MTDLEPQMAERFPNKRKVLPKIAMNPDLGLTFLLLLGNRSSICSSRSEEIQLSNKEGTVCEYYLNVKDDKLIFLRTY